MSATPYDLDRKWSDHWLPLVKQTLALYCIVETPDEIDRKQAADLMTIARRIAVRLRRAGFLDAYRYEFTIRSRRDNGAGVELPKVLQGYGDWMFYAHADEQNGRLALWWLVDLHAFRIAISGDHPIRSGEKPNGDGTHFRWYDLRSFPAHLPILVASSHPLHETPSDRAKVDFDSLRWQGTVAGEQSQPPDQPMSRAELDAAYFAGRINVREYAHRVHALTRTAA